MHPTAGIGAARATVAGLFATVALAFVRTYVRPGVQSVVGSPPKGPELEDVVDDSDHGTCGATEYLGSFGKGKDIRVDNSRG